MPRPKKTESDPTSPKPKRGRPKGSKNKKTLAKLKPKSTPQTTSQSVPKSNTAKVKEDFPHIGFPYRLEYMDGADKRICFFQCENHMEKHLVRHKLNRKTCKISVKED